MKGFTKSDLRSGDKVVYRNGDERFVLIETQSLYAESGARAIGLEDFHENLKFESLTASYDIMQIYRNGELIWEREEKSQAQLDYEKLVEQIQDLQKKAEELKGKLFQ